MVNFAKGSAPPLAQGGIQTSIAKSQEMSFPGSSFQNPSSLGAGRPGTYVGYPPRWLAP
jgi:hypothetical protein